MNKILSLLFFIGVSSALIHFSFRIQALLLLTIICGIVLLTYYIIFKFNKYKKLLLLLLLIFILFLFNLMYYQELSFRVPFTLLLSQIGLGIYLIENKNSLKIYTALYVILNIVILLIILQGIDPGDIAELSSGNIVNYIYLSFSILYVGLYFKKNSRIIITPSILSFTISIWTLGRAGIIASIIFLIGTIIAKYKNKLNKLSISVLFVLIPFIGVYVYEFIVDFIFDILYRFGQRTTVIEDSPRLLISQAYLDELNISKLLFGYDQKDHFFAGYTNLHNSYLDIHYVFGLGGILIIFILLITLGYFLFSKQILYFILLFSLLFRGFTDTVMLVGMYDFTLIFFLLIYVENKYKTKQKIRI